MKRIVISIVILAAMACGCFLSVYAVNSFTDKMIDKIHEVERAFEDGDIETSSQKAKELSEDWNEFVDFSLFVNDPGHALEITSSVAEIHSFAQEGNDELYAACDRAEAQIDMFRGVQNPTFWKIL